MSIANTRFKRCAQLIGASGLSLSTLPRGAWWGQNEPEAPSLWISVRNKFSGSELQPVETPYEVLNTHRLQEKQGLTQ
jgi:hypothetical protein